MVGRENVRLYSIREQQLERREVAGTFPIELSPGWMAVDIAFKLVVPGTLIALALYQLVPPRTKTAE
jgi:hypothetical protein